MQPSINPQPLPRKKPDNNSMVIAASTDAAKYPMDNPAAGQTNVTSASPQIGHLLANQTAATTVLDDIPLGAANLPDHVIHDEVTSIGDPSISTPAVLSC